MEMNTQANATPAKHSSAYGDNFKHLFEGVHFRFPKFQHTHPAVINVNEVADEQLTMGQRVADRVAAGMGSWRFIIIQSVIVVLWVVSAKFLKCDNKRGDDSGDDPWEGVPRPRASPAG